MTLPLHCPPRPCLLVLSVLQGFQFLHYWCEICLDCTLCEDLYSTKTYGSSESMLVTIIHVKILNLFFIFLYCMIWLRRAAFSLTGTFTHSIHLHQGNVQAVEELYGFFHDGCCTRHKDSASVKPQLPLCLFQHYVGNLKCSWYRLTAMKESLFCVLRYCYHSMLCCLFQRSDKIYSWSYFLAWRVYM